VKRTLSLLSFLLLCLPYALCAEKADLIIFSYDRPLQLWALMESIEKNIQNIGKMFVIYRTSTDDFARAYEEIKNTFDTIEYIHQSNNPKNDFKPITMHCLDNCISDYIFFAVDDVIVTRPIDLNECIEALEDTGAYGFYMRLGLHLTECYPMQSTQKIPYGAVHNDAFFVWKFKHGQYDWNYPHSVDMTIFRKKDVVEQLAHFYFTSPNTFEGQWSSRAGHTPNKKGICYLKSHIINVPLNRVQNDWNNRHMHYLSAQELLSLFNAGLKMDINPLQNYVNKSAHMEYIPKLISRSAE